MTGYRPAMRNKSDIREWLPDSMAWRYLGVAAAFGAVVGWRTGVLAGLGAFVAVLGALLVASAVAYRRRRVRFRRAWAHTMEQQIYGGPRYRPGKGPQ